MKNLFYRASHGSRVLAILVFASVFILGEYLAVAPKPALAAGARVSICHRTKSTTNPYRFITVSNSAVAGGGHARHTGAVWTASNTNGQTWGDIIPGDDTDGDQFWSDGSGVASSAYNWDATGKSFMVPLGANLSKCTRMTAKQFYDIGISADRYVVGGTQDNGSWVMIRPSGTEPEISPRRFSSSVAVISVSTKPGAITFAVMPRLPSSRANDRAIPTKPAFDEE